MYSSLCLFTAHSWFIPSSSLFPLVTVSLFSGRVPFFNITHSTCSWVSLLPLVWTAAVSYLWGCFIWLYHIPFSQFYDSYLAQVQNPNSGLQRQSWTCKPHYLHRAFNWQLTWGQVNSLGDISGTFFLSFFFFWHFLKQRAGSFLGLSPNLWPSALPEPLSS